MRLVTAILGRNEGASDRYLSLVLDQARRWSDAVCFLDDRSTDDTTAIATAYGATVRVRESNTPAWGHEASARQELWRWAAEAAGDGWVLFQDCDMTLTRDPRPLTDTMYLNTWCWRLYDLWSPTHYRSDGQWQGHNVPRPWLVRPSAVPEGWTPWWRDRGLHCGHLPGNWPAVAGEAPPEYAWLHWSYATMGHRQKKHAQYLDRRDLLSPDEIAHAESILDAAS